MATKPLPSPDELRQLLTYEPETGKLFWRERPVEMFRADGPNGAEKSAAIWNARYAGREAFRSGVPGGYKTGAIFGVQIRAHRAIWALTNGAWPEGEIDHINGDPSDNRIVNLRDVSRRDNARNTRRHSRNTTGAAGVYFKKQTGRWMAAIGSAGRFVHLGYFDTYDEAAAARCSAEKSHGYHGNHGRA